MCDPCGYDHWRREARHAGCRSAFRRAESAVCDRRHATPRIPASRARVASGRLSSGTPSAAGSMCLYSPSVHSSRERLARPNSASVYRKTADKSKKLKFFDTSRPGGVVSRMDIGNFAATEGIKHLSTQYLHDTYILHTTGAKTGNNEQ